MSNNTTFKDLLTDAEVKKAVAAMQIKEPTKVQEKAIPVVEEGRDLICRSNTGSGKTLAFALPLIQKIKEEDKLQVLVLVPTRELCEQVTEEFRKASKYKKINILEIYGGVSIEAQIKKLPKAHVVIATPGRACDLLNRKALRLDMVQTAVLDEADRMLDMGFIKDVETILKETPNKRQTLMFTATLPKKMERIIQRYMKDPKTVKTKEQVDKTLLKQFYYEVPIRERFHLLVHLLKKEQAAYAIVFCGTRRAVDLVAYNLKKNGIQAQAIHGGLTQATRKEVMSSFHGKRTQVLVASDVAARGIDVKLLSHVYNFDVPKTPQEYVHRIGRTARAGEEGVAITLVSEKDYDSFDRILREPSIKIEKQTPPQVNEVKFVSYIPEKLKRQSRYAKPQRPRFSRRRR